MHSIKIGPNYVVPDSPEIKKAFRGIAEEIKSNSQSKSGNIDTIALELRRRLSNYQLYRYLQMTQRREKNVWSVDSDKKIDELISDTVAYILETIQPLHPDYDINATGNDMLTRAKIESRNRKTKILKC